jgi:hypothetical protein
MLSKILKFIQENQKPLLLAVSVGTATFLLYNINKQYEQE